MYSTYALVYEQRVWLAFSKKRDKQKNSKLQPQFPLHVKMIFHLSSFNFENEKKYIKMEKHIFIAPSKSRGREEKEDLFFIMPAKIGKAKKG